MQTQDAPEVVKYVQRRWANHPVPQAAWRAWADAMAPFSREQITAAVTAYGQSPRGSFLPQPNEIVREIAVQAVAAPEWDEVRRQLGLAVHTAVRNRDAFVWRCPAGECAGDGIVVRGREGFPCSCRPAMIAARRGDVHLHPMVARWVADGFVSRPEVEALVLEPDPFRDAEVRKAWQAFTARLVRAWALQFVGEGSGVPGLDAARGEVERVGLRAPREGVARLGAAAPEGAQGFLAAAGVQRDGAVR